MKSSVALLKLLPEVIVNQREVEHRNRMLRSYFEGRNWDRNGEYALKRQLVLSSTQLLPSYPYVIEDEWEVEPGRTDKGRPGTPKLQESPSRRGLLD